MPRMIAYDWKSCEKRFIGYFILSFLINLLMYSPNVLIKCVPEKYLFVALEFFNLVRIVRIS